MQVKKRLRINVAVLVIAAFVIVIMLFLTLSRINRAMEKSDIASEILSSAFDRSTLRDDYLRNNNERAKVQWFARHEHIGRLLKAASEKFREADDKKTIDEMIKDQESTGKIFSGIVENRERAGSNTDSVILSQETENRMASQLSMRLYDKILFVRKLRESADRQLFSSLKLAGWSIVSFMAIIAAAVIINSSTINWIIADRMRRLRDGASVIGEGNLDYRIDIRGDDEFAELSGAFDAMTAKLRGAYHNLENEIAERRQKEEELLESEERLRRAQEIAHLGSWELDLVNNRLSWSDEVYRICGLQPQEFGASYEAFLEAVHPDDRAAVDAAYSGSLRDGRDTYEIEHRLVRKSDGEVRIVHEKCEHIRDGAGRMIRSIGMVQDITERKRADEDLKKALSELERSNKELEQFAYVASHDLQEPLRMVASYVKLLEKKYKGQLDEKADQYIHFAVDGALRMQKLIEGLLAYSRIGRGGEFTLVDTNEVFSHVVSNLSAALLESHAVITKDDLPRVSGDETQFMQLFQNLIGNAVKFRKPEVPPLVHVSAKRERRNWVFSVRDNGIGMDPAYANRIFLIFQRLHTREEYPGTGIGLALCKKIVERHHGRIWVESAPGEGAIFFFTIRG